MRRRLAIRRVGLFVWVALCMCLVVSGLWMLGRDVVFGLVCLAGAAMGLGLVPTFSAMTSGTDRGERDREVVAATTSVGATAVRGIAFGLFGAAGGFGLYGPAGAVIGAFVGAAIVILIHVVPALLGNIDFAARGRWATIAAAGVVVGLLVLVGLVMVAVGYGIGGEPLAIGIGVIELITIALIVGVLAMPRRT